MPETTPRWRVFGKSVWAAISTILLLVGVGGLPADIEGWTGWLRPLLARMNFPTVGPVMAGALLGAGAMGLFVYVVVRWSEPVQKRLGSLVGLWRYVRITAVGRVTVRWDAYWIDDDGDVPIPLCERNMATKRLPKGALEHLYFRIPPDCGMGLVIDVPVSYKVLFPSFGPELQWTAEVKGTWRRYEARIGEGGLANLHLRDRSLVVPVSVATDTLGEAGWRAVRQTLKECPWWLIAEKGHVLVKPPDDPMRRHWSMDEYLVD